MKTQMVNNVELAWSSAPLEYDYVTLEILLDRDPVVVINREKGLDNLEVELFGPTPTGTMMRMVSLLAYSTQGIRYENSACRTSGDGLVIGT
ncbi:hypothetical protein [Paraburkholderia sp. GAS348]|uniref:hypothetical protein n=1 Tax=Paraburkholderia sp. GAS348 TaxID=3035132 RepID=UPI003D22D4BB